MTPTEPTNPKHNTGDVEQLREQFLVLGPCIGPYDSPHRCSALHCDHCGLCDISEEVLDLIAAREAEARQALLADIKAKRPKDIPLDPKYDECNPLDAGFNAGLEAYDRAIEEAYGK